METDFANTIVLVHYTYAYIPDFIVKIQNLARSNEVVEVGEADSRSPLNAQGLFASRTLCGAFVGNHIVLAGGAHKNRSAQSDKHLFPFKLAYTGIRIFHGITTQCPNEKQTELSGKSAPVID